ncbi:MAG: MarR family transcriptional regulator [Actinomycetia bacterium]|nr:MarR family transcriptional regulator [Actinomycetes bacterium]
MEDITRSAAPEAADRNAASSPGGEPDAQAGARVTPVDHLSFLLVQLGLHGARRFGERLAPLGLEQRHAGMLIRLAANEGRSQQAIAEMIGVNATRMVFLVDELEKLGLVERRRNPADRRSHALYLTDQGRATVGQVRAVTSEHEAEFGAGLTEAQRTQLVSLLRLVAQQQGLHPRGMPGVPPDSARLPC